MCCDCHCNGLLSSVVVFINLATGSEGARDANRIGWRCQLPTALATAAADISSIIAAAGLAKHPIHASSSATETHQLLRLRPRPGQQHSAEEGHVTVAETTGAPAQAPHESDRTPVAAVRRCVRLREPQPVTFLDAGALALFCSSPHRLRQELGNGNSASTKWPVLRGSVHRLCPHSGHTPGGPYGSSACAQLLHLLMEYD